MSAKSASTFWKCDTDSLKKHQADWPWWHAGLAHCPFVCLHRRREALAVGRAPATPWPLCGAPAGTDWSVRSHWRDVPPYCIDKREDSNAVNCSNCSIQLSHFALRVSSLTLCCRCWRLASAVCPSVGPDSSWWHRVCALGPLVWLWPLHPYTHLKRQQQ